MGKLSYVQLELDVQHAYEGDYFGLLVEQVLFVFFLVLRLLDHVQLQRAINLFTCLNMLYYIPPQQDVRVLVIAVVVFIDQLQYELNVVIHFFSILELLHNQLFDVRTVVRDDDGDDKGEAADSCDQAAVELGVVEDLKTDKRLTSVHLHS